MGVAAIPNPGQLNADGAAPVSWDIIHPAVVLCSYALMNTSSFDLKACHHARLAALLAVTRHEALLAAQAPWPARALICRIAHITNRPSIDAL